MIPVRTLVVDDEPLARADLCRLLGANPAISIVGQCRDGNEALASIDEQRPDLVFLDVRMPECDGFEVLERLGTTKAPVVVFVTAYDRYALRAFEAGALDYVLKPFDATRLDRAVARALERVAAQHPGKAPADARIAVRSVGEVVFVRVTGIDWIEAADYYACLHVGAVTHILRRSLTELENEFLPHGFARVHRSAIVNLARVARVTLGADGEHEVELQGGIHVKLGRHYRRSLLAHLELRDTLSTNSGASGRSQR